MRRSRSGWWRACRSTAIVGVDDNWCQLSQIVSIGAGKTVVRVSVRRPLADGLYVEAEQVARASGGRPAQSRNLGRSARCAGAHNAQNAACTAAPWHSACRRP
jgi:UDP-N-acetylmuramoylalanine--D-glutamate ligase